MRQDACWLLRDELLTTARRLGLSPALVFACGALLTVACACDHPNVVHHPTPENAVPNDASLVDQESWRSIAPDARARWLRVRDRIHSTRVTWSIGSDTIGDDLFGEILSAKMDTEGRLVVLDGMNGTVRMFREPGELTGQFGDLHEGPASLRYSRAISSGRDGTIAVYLAPQRVKYFASGHDGWRLTGSADLPVTVESTCAMDDGRVFVQGDPVGGLLGDHSGLFYQVPPQADRELLPFGRPYSGNWSAAAKLSLGLVVCVNPLDHVIFAYTILPLVQAFSSETADVLWRPDQETTFKCR